MILITTSVIALLIIVLCCWCLSRRRKAPALPSIPDQVPDWMHARPERLQGSTRATVEHLALLMKKRDLTDDEVIRQLELHPPPINENVGAPLFCASITNGRKRVLTWLVRHQWPGANGCWVKRAGPLDQRPMDEAKRRWDESGDRQWLDLLQGQVGSAEFDPRSLSLQTGSFDAMYTYLERFLAPVAEPSSSYGILWREHGEIVYPVTKVFGNDIPSNVADSLNVFFRYKGKFDGIVLVPVHSGADVVLPPWLAYYGDAGHRRFVFAAQMNDVILLVRGQLRNGATLPKDVYQNLSPALEWFATFKK